MYLLFKKIGDFPALLPWLVNSGFVSKRKKSTKLLKPVKNQCSRKIPHFSRENRTFFSAHTHTHTHTPTTKKTHTTHPNLLHFHSDQIIFPQPPSFCSRILQNSPKPLRMPMFHCLPIPWPHGHPQLKGDLGEGTFNLLPWFFRDLRMSRNHEAWNPWNSYMRTAILSAVYI